MRRYVLASAAVVVACIVGSWGSPRDCVTVSTADAGPVLDGSSSSSGAASSAVGRRVLRLNVVDDDRGAVGDGVKDDTAALQRAYDCLDDRGLLVMPPLDYQISRTLNWTGAKRVDVEARGARILAPDVRDAILIYGGTDAQTAYDCRFNGLWIDGGGAAKNQKGLVLQNINRAVVSPERIRAVNVGLVMKATPGAGCNNNIISNVCISSCQTGIQPETSDNGCVNNIGFAGIKMVFWGDTPVAIRFGEKQNASGWIFHSNCDIESDKSIRLVSSRSAGWITFRDCWIEGPNAIKSGQGSIVRIIGGKHFPIVNHHGGGVLLIDD